MSGFRETFSKLKLTSITQDKPKEINKLLRKKENLFLKKLKIMTNPSKGRLGRVRSRETGRLNARLAVTI